MPNCTRLTTQTIRLINRTRKQCNASPNYIRFQILSKEFCVFDLVIELFNAPKEKDCTEIQDHSYGFCIF